MENKTQPAETFKNYISKSRDKFVIAIDRQNWNTQMRTAAEDLLIAYDQMRERLQPADEEKIWNKMKVTFTDCWSFDDRIPADGRWLANINHTASVAAPTKEEAFEQIIISLKVLIAHNSDYKTPPKIKGDEKGMREALEKDYKLIPISEITDEARLIAVRWMECNDRNWIGEKHKLASDIMNYARRYLNITADKGETVDAVDDEQSNSSIEAEREDWEDANLKHPAYWKERCEAAEVYLNSIHGRDIVASPEDYEHWQTLKNKNHE